MSQLWATANSEVGDEAMSDAGRGAGQGLDDFSSAITSRCHPLLSAAQVAELEHLKTAYESLSGPEAAEPAHAYFVKATKLCM